MRDKIEAVTDAISRLRYLYADLAGYAAGDILPDGEIVVSRCDGTLASSGLSVRPVTVWIAEGKLSEAQSAGWCEGERANGCVEVTKEA